MIHAFISLSIIHLLLLTTPLTVAQPADHSPVLTRIAFGSCLDQNLPQPIWDPLLKSKPQLFIFMGDNIYADATDTPTLREKYAELGNLRAYQALRRNALIMATWDDHDYGIDDAGFDFPLKRKSQQTFLDFFEIPENDDRRKRPGIYHSEVFGPSGRRVQVVLLDTRYFRDRLSLRETGSYDPSLGPYLPNRRPADGILGEKQWHWLEKQLEIAAELRVIVSSIQVIPEEHGFEKWANFPAERSRLLSMLAGTTTGKILILSGDRHHAEISKIDIGTAQPLYEITSSAMNRPRPVTQEPNRFRVAGLLFEANYGLLDIDWKESKPKVKARIIDQRNLERLSLLP